MTEAFTFNEDEHVRSLAGSAAEQPVVDAFWA